MRIGDLFETKVEEKIDPVIKVGEIGDEHKLASEIGSYVVTPLIEKYLDDFLELYTETFITQTTEIGVWISGYFGSGKSHLAKIMALLVENRKLAAISSCERFLARVPPGSARQGDIQRSLARMGQSGTGVLAFNLNTLTDSRSRPLPSLLLSQYYLSRGYGGNLIYARVIEAELDRQGKLEALHHAVESRVSKSWPEIQRNLSFYRKHLYEAACEVAPEMFPSPQDVEQALREAERGELYNVNFLIDTILEDLKRREKELKKPQRIMFVLDESGQWIENDAGRLAQLQALIEEAAIKGQGKIWIIVTTHGDMGSIYKEARALEGDMKKIEGRFCIKAGLTTENIELVLENRLLKKTLSGKEELEQVYANRGGVLRGLGELANANTDQQLPQCPKEKFATYYPFFPYQIHLIPEIVKSLRSKGGRGEQLSGSTRTLLAITQDILRSGRRPYLSEGVGALVSFDEVYGNLSGEGEVSPDVRTELSKLKNVVPGATTLTPRVAEVLYLIRELPYVPRTKDNLARLLAEHVEDDLPAILARLEPELDRLIKAKIVARIGEEFEFLTGERRTFEEEVAAVESQYRYQDQESGLKEHFIHGGGKHYWRKWLDFDTVSYLGMEFLYRLQIDEFTIPNKPGDITLKLTTPLGALGSTTLDYLENQSLQEQNTILFLSGRMKGFDRDLIRYLAMKEVIDNWKGDSHRSEEARKLAQERETNDLPKLERSVLDGFKDGIRTGRVIFRGSSRALAVNPGQKPGDALRAELSTYWPVLYPKFDKVPVRIVNDQRAIQEVLAGAAKPSKDVLDLKLYDQSGKIDPNCPLLDAIRIHLATAQSSGRRVLGKELLDTFSAPPYGWDPNAVRVGVAALVRTGAVKIVINKKTYTNPADRDLVDALRVSRNFDRTELVLEVAEVDPDILTETRSFLMTLAKRRGIDETPAALSEVAGNLADTALAKAATVKLWAGAAGFPLPQPFADGVDAWQRVKDLANPIHRVLEIHGTQDPLSQGHQAIEQLASFQSDKGSLFTDLENFTTQLLAIEHLTEPDSLIRKLLEAHKTAVKSASFADKETWQQLQSLKAQAALELQTLMEEWRTSARRLIDTSLTQLPDELSQRGLNPELEEKLSLPLRQLKDSLDGVTVPAKAAALSQQVEAAIRRLGDQVLEEAAKKKAETEPGDPGAKEAREPRPVQRLRLSELVTVSRVTNPQEWDSLKDKMDKRVRSLLDKGFDVELG